MSRASSNGDASEAPAKKVISHADDGMEYPAMTKRIIIMISVYLAIFLITLDQNIISTAIPRITDQFHSLPDVGWYGSAYLLTMCSFSLIMGRVYRFYPVKPLFLGGIVLFEIGSAICGAAPNSTAFIVGRAISGLGSSGMFSGVMVIMSYTVPLRQRPIWQGLFGAVFAIGSVIGPLVGGAFTDHVTWRWCFYINLPVGAVSIIVCIFLINLKHQKLETPAQGIVGKFKQLDPIGSLVFFPGIICLVLALQWGGTKYAWNSARIIVLLVIFVVMILAFIAVQAWQKENATIPPRIASQRSIIAACVYCFFSGAGMMVLMYYLPIWFQAIKGTSATDSGVRLIPTVLATVISSLLAGVITSKIGYYAPFFILSSLISPIGAGLLSTLQPDTGSSKWIGYQILFGVGLGFGLQQHMNVVQTVLSRRDISTGAALVMFTRFLGSAIFVPVGENLLVNSLVKKVASIPGIDPKDVTEGGATALRKLATGDNLRKLLQYYNDALMQTMYLTTALCAVTIFASVFVEWRSMTTPSAAKSDKATSDDEAVPAKAENGSEKV